MVIVTPADEARIIAKFRGQFVQTPRPKPVQAEPPKPQKRLFDPRIPCIHLGKVLDHSPVCSSCWLFECKVHEKCRIARRETIDDAKICQTCDDYRADKI